ncbi:hypothetical protein DD571_31140 [Klebsiella pneumoniae]|nr:hypothetical protein DD571_31140 [Klebsiella pneumoniae]
MPDLQRPGSEKNVVAAFWQKRVQIYMPCTLSGLFAARDAVAGIGSTLPAYFSFNRLSRLQAKVCRKSDNRH